MFTGVQNINSRTFYFNSSGVMQIGWQKISGKYFYFQMSGNAGTLGRMITGWLKYGGEIYYLKKYGEKGVKGRRLTGWNQIDKQVYYFSSSGKLQTGWQKIGSRTFYFKATGTYGVRGKMFTGWVTIGGNKYYFKRTGDFGTKGMRFQGGYKTIDGKRYYFDSNGVYRENPDNDGYVTDPVTGVRYRVESQYYTDPQIGSGSDQVTEEEFMAALLYTEAGDQGLEGQIMVAMTIYNRMMNNSFPSTMRLVVYAKSQFEVISNGRLTDLLEGIRDNEKSALDKINNYDSMEAAKKAAVIYENYKSGKTSKRIIPGVSSLKNKDFDYVYFMTHDAFNGLGLDPSKCGVFKYKDHTFFRKWAY